ncbi:MAG TPA: hypothetical protein VGS23_06055 [Thermoplasmata archaeon]|nr:hypothetical protein [Thermoplasmata archaeon]HEV2316689.1 hypothetical protein [Thermoplasmata archaeon]
MIAVCNRCNAQPRIGPRSQFCADCWTKHQRSRRLNNVHAFRQRARAAAVRERAATEEGLPSSEDLAWLHGLGLGLAEHMAEALNLWRAGYRLPQPDLVGYFREALRRYDLQAGEFTRRASLDPDPEGRADRWRSLYEEIREALK